MDDTPSTADGRRALESSAPQVAAALGALEGAAWNALDAIGRTALGALAARVVAAQHGLPPLAPPPRLGVSVPALDAGSWRRIDGLDDASRVALAFAEQMSFDVASLQETERQALFGALGGDAVPFVQFVYVADLLPRARAALDALFGETGAWPEPPASAPPLQDAFDAVLRLVPQLRALDPVATELVRLLGARRHRCRICQSLRSRSALVAGADESLFEAVDRYDARDEARIRPAQRAALAFADAMLSPPARVTPEAAAALRDAWPPEACVELVLDVVRNATNKVAVALAADAPHVESGVEIYDVGPDGELLYGLEAP